MKRPPRKSVPTHGLHRYLDQAGWLYIMPDFNVPNHSIIDWIGTGEPQEPAEERSEDERLRGIADAMGPNV